MLDPEITPLSQKLADLYQLAGRLVIGLPGGDELLDGLQEAEALAEKQGLAEDLDQLIRVALTNPADLHGFIEANYPQKFARNQDESSSNCLVSRMFKECGINVTFVDCTPSK
ncbi:hypothetical protein [Zavarzinella formosa]|uniref:hypothetical protein n=1 Tax=Zavarzinella formosa TaxID=360055 RepID=UPI00030EA1E2|nr:hypothetical protein [Zavarzinella formosa]